MSSKLSFSNKGAPKNGKSRFQTFLGAAYSTEEPIDHDQAMEMSRISSAKRDQGDFGGGFQLALLARIDPFFFSLFTCDPREGSVDGPDGVVKKVAQIQ